MGARVLFVVKDLEGAEPLGALYVAGALELAGHDCRFVGTRGTNVDAEVRRFDPDVIGFGTTTGMHRSILGLAAHLREVHPRSLKLLGGPHATFFPQAVMSPGIDVVCRGEGEGAAVELCDALVRGDDLRGIKDLWVKSEGRVFTNPPRPLVGDLDTLPHPPRRLVYAWDDRLRRRALKSFTANRGCPYPCAYCFNPALFEHYGPAWRKVRVRSPEDVVAEIAEVRRQGPLEIVAFRESIFAYTHEWLAAFGALYQRVIGLPFYCHVRADALDAEMVALLRAAGCHSVNVGIETASEDLANRVLGRSTRMDRVVRGIRLLKAAGIVCFADNMVGLPGGTFEDDLRTLELNIALGVDYAAATLCTPYPGTGLAAWAKEHGYWDGDVEGLEETYYTGSAFKFASALEQRKIENLQKLFALTAALPAALPLVKRLVALPPNDFFHAAFRAFYVLEHMTQVMPRRPEPGQVLESLLSIFGVYRGRDGYDYAAPVPQALPLVASETRFGGVAGGVALPAQMEVAHG